LNGLDLFSGIGGITLALEGYVQPVAYCENDRYAIGVLLSRMSKGELPAAPVWDDVRTLRGSTFNGLVDIVYGGFPCQDISVAGRGAGLGGKRSGLFSEIVRLASEIRPRFIFLENVPAIRNRGANIVVGELAGLGYDTRWITLSAAEIGANHRRERWWLLANAQRSERWPRESNGHDAGREIAERKKTASRTRASGEDGRERSMADAHGDALRIKQGRRSWAHWESPAIIGHNGASRTVAHTAGNGRRKDGARKSAGPSEVAHTNGAGLKERWQPEQLQAEQRPAECAGKNVADAAIHGRLGRLSRSGETASGQPYAEIKRRGWWATEPAVGRVVNGLPARVDRLRALGNAVVPAQAREAFERLMGLK